MKTIGMLWFVIIMFWGFLIDTTSLLAQDIEIVEELSEGYLVRIGADTLTVITQEMEIEMNSMGVRLDSALKVLEEKDILIATYERVKESFIKTDELQKKYDTELEKILKGYINLADTYRNISRKHWLTFTGGLGATGSDTKPIVLVELGIRRFRICGLLQEGNSGVVVGMTFPLF